jgi:hypothetical protein
MESAQTFRNDNIAQIIQAAQQGNLNRIRHILDEQEIISLIEEAENCQTYITLDELHEKLRGV